MLPLTVNDVVAHELVTFTDNEALGAVPEHPFGYVDVTVSFSLTQLH